MSVTVPLLSVFFCLVGRLNGALAVAEANAYAVLLTPTTHSDAVSVLNEPASLTIAKVKILLAAFSHFEKTATLAGLSATDGARAHHVTGAQGAATKSVVGDHLGEGPQQVLASGLGDSNIIDALSYGTVSEWNAQVWVVSVVLPLMPTSSWMSKTFFFWASCR